MRIEKFPENDVFFEFYINQNKYGLYSIVLTLSLIYIFLYFKSSQEPGLLTQGLSLKTIICL